MLLLAGSLARPLGFDCARANPLGSMSLRQPAWVKHGRQKEQNQSCFDETHHTEYQKVWGIEHPVKPAFSAESAGLRRAMPGQPRIATSVRPRKWEKLPDCEILHKDFFKLFEKNFSDG